MGFAENSHLHGTAHLGYWEAIKCHFEVGYEEFGPSLNKIQFYFISTNCNWAEKGLCRKSSLSWNCKFRVPRGAQVPIWCHKLNICTRILPHLIFSSLHFILCFHRTLLSGVCLLMKGFAVVCSWQNKLGQNRWNSSRSFADGCC